MADNVTIPASGSGTATPVVATDDVAGVHYQYVKLADGAADSSAKIGGDATNGLDVDVTRVQGTVTVDSELPAAAALADGASNPTVPGVGAFEMAWNGSTWDRVRSPNDTVQTAQNIAMSSTANAVTVSGLNGYGAASIQVTGTWTGTLIFEGTVDNSNWFAVAAVAIGGTGALVTTATANGQWQTDVAGLVGFRMRCSVTGTGTAVASIRAVLGAALVGIGVPLPAGNNNIGDVDVATLPALPAGTNNIGDVDVLTLPALPAGTNNIGDVDVLTLPSIPAGNNNIGDVDIASIAAGDNNIGNVDVVTLPALPAGANNIGDVDVLTLPALPAGTNNIGDVDVLTLPSVTIGTMANLTESLVDDAAFTPATSRVVPVGFTLDDTTPDTVNEGDIGAARMTADRAVHTSIRDSAGNNRGANVNASNQLSVSVDNANVSANINQIGGVAPTMGNGAAGTGTQRVTIASDSTGSVAATQATAANLNAQVQGSVAHDGVDSGNPEKIGARAIAHGTNPTAVAAGDRTDLYANRAGILFVMGGHPNIVMIEAAYTAAQTDTAIVTIATGLKIIVTQVMLTCDNANTVDVGARVGFGTANTPTTTGVVLTHPGIAAGSGVSRGDGSGILGIGADNEDLRITCEVPTTGSIRVLVSYYTIET